MVYFIAIFCAMWDLSRGFECIYIISSGKVFFYLEKQEMELKWEKFFILYGLNPSVMFTKPRSWRRIDRFLTV